MSTTPDPHLDQITAEASRAAAVLAGLYKCILDEGEARGETDHRIDQLMVIGVLNWTAADGTEREDTVMAAETKRRYVQRGILTSAVARLDEVYVDDPDDDEPDEADDDA